jgi:hypothetical protein
MVRIRVVVAVMSVRTGSRASVGVGAGGMGMVMMADGHAYPARDGSDSLQRDRKSQDKHCY